MVDQQDYRRVGVGVPLLVRPGTHIACFHEGREDLLQVLIPYFEAGLEDGECCIWVASPELKVEEAREVLAQAIPNVTQLLASGQLSILDRTELYFKGGLVDWERVLQGWLQREARALSQGYPCLRISGSPASLQKGDWERLITYERAVDDSLGQYLIIGLCTYDSAQFSAMEIAQVVNSHQYTLERKGDEWQLAEPLISTKKAKELERAVERLSILHRLTSISTETLDLARLLERSLRQTLELPGLEGRGAIFLMNETGTSLSLMVSQGLAPEVVAAESTVPVGECLCGLSAQTGAIIVSASAAEDERHTRMCDMPDHSHVISPLMRREKVMGVLCLYAPPRQLEDLDIDLLHTVAQELALSIERAQLFEQLSKVSITDELTGLYNRRHFYEVLETEMYRAQRYGHWLSVVMIDIDGFKAYNDKFGHTSGDAVLRVLGQTLKSLLRRTDVAFRYGGDEFAVVLPATAADRAERIVNRMRSRWLEVRRAEDFVLGIPLGLSAGIAEFPGDAETADGLVFLADTALYRSKREGGNKSTLVSDLGALTPDVVDRATLDQVYALSATVEARDPYTYGHSKRVAAISAMIGKAIGLSRKELADLNAASLLHDIGKVGVSDAILTKSAKPTKDEWKLIRKHSAEGARIVGHVGELAALVPMIRHHHEWYDGTGYPDGLKGEDIPLGARILAIADAYDTMTTARTYRHVASQEEALEELRRCSGTQFAPELVEAFCRAMDEAARQD
ncbi:MAG: diguanylate cyclase [Dehalococcoidia bacterium]